MTDLVSALDIGAEVRLLGERLRNHRKLAQVTGEKLAADAALSQPKISKIERGRMMPSPSDVERIAIALRLPLLERNELIEKATALAEYSRSWRTIHRTGLVGAQREAQFTEQLADLIRYFQPVLVPGLLQYRQYAREILLRANITKQVDIDDAVNIRMERQDLLHSSEKTFQFILLEAALHQRYCAAEVMRVQLDLLSSLSRLPNVSLGIVQDSTMLPRVALNGFGIFDSRAVSVETMHGETVLAEPEDVRFYENVFAEFASVAEFGDEAGLVIDRARLLLS